MEAAGIGGPMLGIVLLPGLLAAGIKASFRRAGQLDRVQHLLSRSRTSRPSERRPPRSSGGHSVSASPERSSPRRSGTWQCSCALVEPRMVLLTPVVGLGVAGLAIAFQENSDKDSSQVLFSGQDALPPLIQDASDWTVGALVLSSPARRWRTSCR